MNIRFHVGPAFLLACICLGNFAPVNAADTLEGIPLVWKPTSPMSERAPIDLKGLEDIKFQVALVGAVHQLVGNPDFRKAFIQK